MTKDKSRFQTIQQESALRNITEAEIINQFWYDENPVIRELAMRVHYAWDDHYTDTVDAENHTCDLEDKYRQAVNSLDAFVLLTRRIGGRAGLALRNEISDEVRADMDSLA